MGNDSAGASGAEKQRGGLRKINVCADPSTHASAPVVVSLLSRKRSVALVTSEDLVFTFVVHEIRLLLRHFHMKSHPETTERVFGKIKGSKKTTFGEQHAAVLTSSSFLSQAGMGSLKAEVFTTRHETTGLKIDPQHGHFLPVCPPFVKKCKMIWF